jgi:hypothetical protein
MILVLETNGCLLHLFSSVAEVESHLEAIDIENREYEFCDDTGQRFIGEITTPVTRFGGGRFRLVAEGVPDSKLVSSFLARARSLDRGCGELQTLDDLRTSLARAKS